MAAARIGVLLITAAAFGSQAENPRCHIKGWGGDFNGKYTSTGELYRGAVAMENAKGMKFYLGGTWPETSDGYVGSYWALSDSWGAQLAPNQGTEGFMALNHIHLLSINAGSHVNADFLSWAWYTGFNAVDNPKIKCTLHSSLKAVDMLDGGNPTSVKAWGFMHQEEVPDDVTKCKSKSSWADQKCINKCDDEAKCAKKCKKKCSKACECSRKQKRLRLV